MLLLLSIITIIYIVTISIIHHPLSIYYKLVHFRPSTVYTHNVANKPALQIVDHVVKVENMDTELPKLFASLFPNGPDSFKVPHTNSKYIHKEDIVPKNLCNSETGVMVFILYRRTVPYKKRLHIYVYIYNMYTLLVPFLSLPFLSFLFPSIPFLSFTLFDHSSLQVADRTS